MVDVFQSEVQVSRLSATTGALTLAVTTGGSDAPSSARPNRLFAGDYSALPFATLAAARAALPSDILHDVQINIGAGTFAGALFIGFGGSERLRVIGTLGLSALASGANIGTAGTGTTQTSMVKPTAAANWTANDLRGKLLRITNGGGFVPGNDPRYPMVRAIRSNTTTTLVVDEVIGMDDSTDFEIVTPTTFIEEAAGAVGGESCCIGGANSTCQLSLESMRINDTDVPFGVLIHGGLDLSVIGCFFDESGLYGLAALDVVRPRVDHCYFFGGANSAASIVAGQRCSARGLVLDDSRVEIDSFQEAYTLVDARTCAGTALRVRYCNSAVVGCVANSCTATPLDMQGCAYQAVGPWGINGTNAGTPKGISISKGGQYALAGASLAGADANQIAVEDKEISYTTLSTYGGATVRGTTLHWGSGTNLVLSKQRITANGGDELTTEGDLIVGGTIKHFGVYLALGDAGGAPVAAAGSDQAGATLARYTHTIVTSGTGGVRLRPAIAGVQSGTVLNKSGGTINVYPPVGGQFNQAGLAANAPIGIPDESLLHWFFDGTYYYGM